MNNGTSDRSISLIVPCWRDEENALAFAQEWSGHPLIHEIIIAAVHDNRDGGMSSVASQTCGNGTELVHPRSTSSRVEAKIKRCDTDHPGRGPQMNLGAKLASGDVLLFHHVDSLLMDEHLRSLVDTMRHSQYVGGAFYRKFDERHPRLRRLETFERWHCRAFGTIYGDQTLFVRRDHFQRIGGFASIPLMEDVEFSRRLRRSGKIRLLDPPMKSSPRKQIEQGAWKVTLLNLLFLVFFRCGVAPERLHRWYYARKTKAAGLWKKRWNAFRNPIDEEKTQILKERWNSLTGRTATPESDFRPSSHPLRIHSRRELLFVPLHALLSAQRMRIAFPFLR